MAWPNQNAYRSFVDAFVTWLIAFRLRQPRREDRVHFATTVHVEITDTAGGFDLRYAEPDTECLIQHSASIQCSASKIERLLGYIAIRRGQMTEGHVALTLVDRTDERVRLAGKAMRTSHITVGRSVWIAMTFEGWMEHAVDGGAYHHSGAMVGRIMLAGDRDAEGWSLQFMGDYTAAPKQVMQAGRRFQLTSAA